MIYENFSQVPDGVACKPAHFNCDYLLKYDWLTYYAPHACPIGYVLQRWEAMEKSVNITESDLLAAFEAADSGNHGYVSFSGIKNQLFK